MSDGGGGGGTERQTEGIREREERRLGRKRGVIWRGTEKRGMDRKREEGQREKRDREKDHQIKAAACLFL